MHGTLLLGVQLENYVMSSSEASIGDDFDKVLVTMSEHNSQIRLGNEWSFSTFLQEKHYFSSHLIANVGIRYDYKRRFNGRVMHAFSPRLAFIYKLNRWNFKACYARSFVDAPYFYRANTVATYRGSEDLKPEYLDAVQLSAMYSVPSIYLTYDCNFYYNKLTGLLYNDKQAANTERPVYSNAGSLDLFGIENSFSYNPPGLDIYMNLTYQRVLNANNYVVIGHQVEGIPAVTMNLVASKLIYRHGLHNLWLNGNLSCYSKQRMGVSSYLDGTMYVNDDYRIKGTAIVDMSLSYKFKNIETSLLCKNMIGTRYTRASLYGIDVLQQGRSFMWKIGYTF